MWVVIFPADSNWSLVDKCYKRYFSSDIAFLAFSLVHSISVISSYTVRPNMETDGLEFCQAGN